jgi:formylglycine-generating enzyme required for sulfatase activity
MNRRLAGLLCLTLAAAADAAAGEGIEWIEPATNIRFVPVRAGCFTMGTSKRVGVSGGDMFFHLAFKADVAADERPAHKVCLDRFWIGRNEVTADQWKAVMAEAPPHGRSAEPAGGITWRDAEEFARRLTEQGKDGSRYRLPTEAEWEYACRAGSDGKTAETVAAESLRRRNESQSVPQVAAVGQGAANAWGLYDMLGNVWEWVGDDYEAAGYRRHLLHGPQVSLKRSQGKVVRGGSAFSEALHLRCANRSHYPETSSLPQVGLRLVREAGPRQKSAR